MAQKKFTQLPAADTPLVGDEIIAIVQGGVSKQTTVSDVSVGTVSTVPTLWNFATSGTNPGDDPTDLTKMYFISDDSVVPRGTLMWWDAVGSEWLFK
jgi:hypothetical protein